MENIDNLKKSHSNLEEISPGIWQLLKSRKLPTLTYCAVFLSFGLCVAFLGPTVMDLSCMTHSSTDQTFWMFLSQTSAMLVGSILTGAVLGKMDCTNHILLVATFMQAITMLLVPVANSLPQLAFILALMGFHMGVVDTAGNVAMVRLYHKNVSTFIQAMHFCYGLGALVSPMVAGPFLDDESCNHIAIIHLNSKLNRTKANASSGQPIRMEPTTYESNLQYAFYIMSAMQIPAIALITLLIVQSRKCSDESNLSETTPIVQTEEEPIKMAPCWLSIPGMCFIEYPWMACWALLSAALLIFTSDGLQASFASYVFVYGKSALPELTKQHAANLDAVFWGTFTIGRLIAVITSVWLRPAYILLYDLLGCLISVVALWLFPVSQTLLLVSTAMVGFFLASVSPAIITYMEQRVGLTASATSCLVFIAALGELSYPIMVGNLLSAVGPTGFTLSSLGSTIAAIILFSSLVAKLYLKDEIEKGLPGGYAKTGLFLRNRVTPGARS